MHVRRRIALLLCAAMLFCLPVGAEGGIAVPEAAVPEPVADPAVPEAVVDPVATEAVAADPAAPEVAVPDPAVPEVAVPDPAAPDAAVVDPAAPDAVAEAPADPTEGLEDVTTIVAESNPTVQAEVAKLTGQSGGEARVFRLGEAGSDCFYILVTAPTGVSCEVVKNVRQNGEVVASVLESASEPLSAEALSVYQFQLNDTTNVAIDNEKAAACKTVEDYVAYLASVLDNMDGTAPNSNACTAILAYIAGAVAATSTQDVDVGGNTCSIGGNEISAAANTAVTVAGQLQSVLDERGMTLGQATTPTIQLNLQGIDPAAPVQVELRSDLLEQMRGKLQEVRLLFGSSGGIYFSTARLEAILAQTSSIHITIAPGASAEEFLIQFADAAGQPVDSIAESMGFIFPANEERSSVTVTLGDGRTITYGGIYSPEQGTLSLDANMSGTYQLIQNMPAITDMEGQSEEGKSAVSYLVGHAIMLTDGNGAFHPDDLLSRYDFIKAAVTMFGKIDAAATTTFSDIPPEREEYRLFVASAQKAGLTEGYDQDRFDGDNAITFEQLIVVCARQLVADKGYQLPADGEIDEYLGKMNVQGNISDWARGYIALAVREGVIVGNGEEFQPERQPTRLEAAIRLYRVYNLFYRTQLPQAAPETSAVAPVVSAAPATPAPVPSQVIDPTPQSYPVAARVIVMWVVVGLLVCAYIAIGIKFFLFRKKSRTTAEATHTKGAEE